MCLSSYLKKKEKEKEKEDDFCASLILLLFFLQLMKFLEKRRQRKSQSYPMMSAAGLTRKGIVLGKMGNLSKDNKPVIGTFQKALPKHHNPNTLKKLTGLATVYSNPELANEEHEKGIPF